MQTFRRIRRLLARFTFLAVALTWALSAEGENASPAQSNLLFSASYNSQSEKAEFARGKPESINFKRTLQYLDANVAGAVKTGFQTLDNESCRYEMMGNFDPREGAVSLWVRAENWNSADPRAHAFFTAEIPGKYQLLLHKPSAQSALVLQVVAVGTREVRCAVNWKAKEWHKVDATWGAGPLKLFVDGELAAEEPKEKQATEAGKPLPAPEPSGYISVNPNHYFANDPACLATDRTTVDEVRIFSRASSVEEVRAAYLEARKQLAGGIYRKPLVTIPLARQTVKLDGKLEEAEWSDASQVPILCQTGRPQLSGRIGEVYLKYDQQNLYLGFHSRGGPLPAARFSRRDEAVWEDPAFEMIFIGNAAGAQKIQFAINCANAIFDMKNHDMAWNGVQQSAAGSDGDGWSAEIVLPFKDLGVPPPSPGVCWKGNFIHDWNQLKGGYASWAVASTAGGETSFGNETLFGTLRFGPEGSGVRIQSVGNLDRGKVDARVLGGVAARRASFRLTAENTPPQETTQPMKDGEAARFEAAAALGLPGLLALTVADAAGSDLAVFDQPFTARPPMVLTYSCWPQHRRLDVTLNLGNLDEASLQAAANGALKGELQLTDAEGKEVRSRVAIVPRQAQFNAALPFPAQLPPGKYLVRARLQGPSGNSFMQEKTLEVPPDDFLKAGSGVNHDVPDPWTPIVVADNTLKVLNREYRIGTSPFPVGISSLGEELLLGPVEWVVTTAKGDEAIVWNTMKVVAGQKDAVRLKGKGRLAMSGTPVNCVATLEFDGQWLATVTFDPGARPLEIHSMHLQYAVPARSGQHVLAPLVRPWENDRVLLDLFYGIDQPCSGQHPMGGFWVTGMKTGLYFFTPTDGNWVCQAGKPNVRVTRKSDRSEVRVLLIHQKVLLKQPATYVIGMTATPVRPRPPRDVTFPGRINPATPPVESNLTPGTYDWIFQAGKWQNWISLVNLQPQALRDSIQAKRKVGIRYFFQYSCALMITGNNPYEDYWGPTWSYGNHYEKKETYACCPNSSFRDLLAWQAENLARDFGVGPYFDMSSVDWCDSRAHGCGYDDAFGRAARTVPVLGYRDELKRIYRVTHRHGCKVWNHNHSLFILPVHSFSDLWLPGEQYTTAMVGKEDHFYTQHVPRTDYQVEMNPFLRGVRMVFLPQYARSAELSGEKDFEKWSQDSHAWATERLLAMLLPHDIGSCGAYMCGKPLEKTMEVFKQKGLIDPPESPSPHAGFTGYWDHPKLTTADPELMLSYYTFPGESRVLAVLSNPTLKERTAVLKFDPKDFGLTAGYRIRDEYRNEDLTVTAAKGIPMPPENFRLLSVEPTGVKP